MNLLRSPQNKYAIRKNLEFCEKEALKVIDLFEHSGLCKRRSILRKMALVFQINQDQSSEMYISLLKANYNTVEYPGLRLIQSTSTGLYTRKSSQFSFLQTNNYLSGLFL